MLAYGWHRQTRGTTCYMPVVFYDEEDADLVDEIPLSAIILVLLELAIAILVLSVISH